MKTILAALTAINLLGVPAAALCDWPLEVAVWCISCSIVTGISYAILDRLDKIRDAIAANKPDARS